MYFPGWDLRSTQTKHTEQKPKPREKSTVRRPSGIKEVASPPPGPSGRHFSLRSRGLLDDPSKLTHYQCGKEDFLINAGHVLTLRQDDYEIVSAQRWEEEYEKHRTLTSIPFFANFRTLKLFYRWRTNVRRTKFNSAREFLRENLFIANQALHPRLMDVRKLCCEISDRGLCDWDRKQTFCLQEFQENQVTQQQEVSTDLKKFQSLVKELAMSACPDFFSNSDDNNPWYRRRDMKQPRCFLRLVDCLVAHTLHELMVNGVTELRRAVCERDIVHGSIPHSEPAPARDGTGKNPESGSSGVRPLFITELMLDTNALIYRPPEEDFQEAFVEMISGFEKTVLSVPTLMEDQDFSSGTERPPDKKVSDALEKSLLESMIENDVHLQKLITDIQESLRFAFRAAKKYSSRFENVLQFHQKNQSLDLEELQKQDPALPFYEEALRFYHREHQEATAIEQKTSLGFLLVDQTKLKEKHESFTLYCLELIKKTLALTARKKLDAVIDEACEAKFKLQLRLKSPEEEDDLLKSILGRIVALEVEKKPVPQIFSLMSAYSVPMSPENLVAFNSLQPSFVELHDAITEALHARL